MLLASTGAGAPPIVGAATVVFPACAVGAAWAVGTGRARLAGVLLVLSAATPTYFAWAVNVPALAVGLCLLVTPRLALPRSR